MKDESVKENARSLSEALHALTRTIQAALAEYVLNLQSPALDYSERKWRGVALRLLQADTDSLDLALSSSASEASLQVFLCVGKNQLGLAKNLDAFRFDFAGKEFEERLTSDVNLTVHVASQLIHSLSSLRKT